MIIHDRRALNERFIVPRKSSKRKPSQHKQQFSPGIRKYEVYKTIIDKSSVCVNLIVGLTLLLAMPKYSVN